MTVTITESEGVGQKLKVLFRIFVRYAKSKGFNNEDAEDLAQEALKDVTKHASHIEWLEKSDLKTILQWAFPFLRNEIKQFRRQHKRRQTFLESLFNSNGNDSNHNGQAEPEQECLDQEHHDLLQRAFAELSADDQRIYALTMQGYSSAQIAEMLGLVNARDKKMRLRKRLREILTKLGFKL